MSTFLGAIRAVRRLSRLTLRRLPMLLDRSLKFVSPDAKSHRMPRATSQSIVVAISAVTLKRMFATSSPKCPLEDPRPRCTPLSRL